MRGQPYHTGGVIAGMKRMICILLAILLSPLSALAAPLESSTPFTLETPSYLLMEASTGQVIFEKNADERRPVASVTKLMTILLVLEAIDAAAIRVDEKVTVSREAASMGGSQALLDAGSQYAVEDLLRSTIIASANDSAVALAEHIAGTEANFVDLMNNRAKELQLTNTVYKNCTGLPADGQFTSARDVATLSREVGKHPMFFKYSTIWMDTIQHKGGRVTDLTNTNRLVRFYDGCDGFKTGSTNEARYCISATAQKDGMRMIAVVLGTSASQTRFNEARQMLEYGFTTYRLFSVCSKGDSLGLQVEVKRGGVDAVMASAGEDMVILMRRGDESAISLEIALPDSIQAPVSRGDVIGEIRVLKSGSIIATLPAVAGADVGLPGYLEALLRILQAWK